LKRQERVEEGPRERFQGEKPYPKRLEAQPLKALLYILAFGNKSVLAVPV
jgi:hypothetical protein